MSTINDLIYGDVNKALETIRKANEKKDETIEYQRETIRKLKEEYSKDEEIQKLQAELDAAKESIRYGFPITKEQQEAIEAWKRKHEEEVHGLKTLDDRLRAGGACGGSYSYHFQPCSLGVSGVIRCHCGAEFEFQEIG